MTSCPKKRGPITFDTVRSGCRHKVAPTTTPTTFAVGSPIACGKLRASKAYNKRTPGLFKVEWHGMGFVELCSKTYYCFGSADKYSTKGLSKRHSEINKDTFLDVLTNQRSSCGWNRGFRVIKSSVLTYIQERAALNYFYAKREVLAGGLTTAPLDV